MKINYVCPLIAVEDIQKSRMFYENILKQEVEMDHGANVAFKGGFAIHDIAHYQGLLGESDTINIQVKKNFLELYFESEDLDRLQEKLDSINTKFLHRIREQPWGQRVMRFFDPDGYIIEVGEPLAFVVKRLASENLTMKEIAERSSVPLEFVDMVLNNPD